jgi:hypothetical protein
MGQQSMIIVLLGSLMLSFSVFGFMGMWSNSTDTIADQYEREQAYNAATSAVNLSFSKLRLNKSWRTGYNGLSVANGTASLRVFDIGVDTVQIEAVGNYNGVQHRVSCVAKLRSIFPTVNSALTVFGDSVDFTNNGKSFWIDGRDHNADFSLGSNPAVDGIGLESSKVAEDVTNQVVSNGVDNLIVGQSGPPSIGTFPPMDLQQLRDYYAALRTMVIPPGKYANNAVLGTLAKPEIVHVPGDLEWDGVITGAGILVVDGALRLKGKITWSGIVLTLSGDVIIELGGTGTPRLLGTTFIGNKAGAVSTHVHVDGNPAILYSYSVIQTVLANLNLLRVEVIKYWE